MMLHHFTLAFSMLLVTTSQALRCYECENVKSIQDCKLQGRIRECQSNENSCETHTRKGSYGILVTRSCKQKHACNTNWDQNLHLDTYKVQCNMAGDWTVCRCCCFTDLCAPDTYDCTETVVPEKKCRSPRQIEHGSMSCNTEVDKNSKYSLNTVCTYSCDSGYKMKGESIIVCKTRSGSNIPEFIPEAPTCEKYCQPPHQPKHGFTVCAGGKKTRYGLGETCQYQCNSGYKMKGKRSTDCKIDAVTGNARFIPAVPTCTGTCDEIKVNTNTTTLSCLNDAAVGSVCRFNCSENYLIEPPKIETARCQENFTWTQIPCCLEKCRGKADLVVVLDASESIDEGEWGQMRNAVSTLLQRINIGENDYNVGLFRFYSGVKDEFQLNTYANDKPGMLTAVAGLRKGETKGTHIGTALHHASNVMFTHKNGDRADAPNVLLLLTDGKASKSDKIKPLPAAAELKARKTIIYAVGIGNDIDQAELEQISEKSGGGFVKGNFDGLGEALAVYSERLCHRACP